jgi:ATP-dependent RNA helicase HrpB
MQNLPINNVLVEIKSTLNTHNRVVLQAPPGAGKTTAVPIALLNQLWLDNKQIIVLEPRRIAARNAAARMAFLLGEKVGQTVGYQIRQDNCYSEDTKILVVTEGILTRKLQADPEQKKTALVIFDEFHERSLHADLSLALCLQSQQILHEELKILVMSATLNTRAISELLMDAPVIQSEGRSYAVDIHYVDKPLKTATAVYEKQQQLIFELTKQVKQIIKKHTGNCLVFLPGVKEINQLSIQLKQFLSSAQIENVIVTPLHGSLSKQLQDQAIASPEKGIRKIVLATNIAETSLTIEGINCVIDSGLERILVYNPASAMNSLKTQFISEDSAIQRCGRAGRLSKGDCYRIWTAQQQKRLVKHSIAEILHSDLSSLVLELANWGVREVEELQWMDLPPQSSVKQAKILLKQLDAIDSNETINSHGRDMLKLGAHPRLAHMMLSAVKINQAYQACLIAAILTEKNCFKANVLRSADINEQINVLNDLKSSNKNNHQVNYQQCKRIIQTADDFFKRLKQCISFSIDYNIDIQYSGVLLAYAYADRIARQREPEQARYLLSNGKGALIPEYLQHHLYEYLVVANLDVKTGQSEATIYLSAEILETQLDEYFPHLFEKKDIISWNDTLNRVESKQIKSIGRIKIDEKNIKSESVCDIHTCLLKAIEESGTACLNWSAQAINLQQRLIFIRHYLNSHADLKSQIKNIELPDFSEKTLLKTLSIWLLPHLTNENSFKQCHKLDVYTLLKSQLSWEQQQLINQLAPEKIMVPSGSSIRVDYNDINQPILAVRLQEVFGLYETPSVMNGYCQLMMHLLSPAHRPMQVTRDLGSFWKTTYHEVKKELRGKYKRHYWPDDPLTAQATSKTRKNMHR